MFDSQIIFLKMVFNLLEVENMPKDSDLESVLKVLFSCFMKDQFLFPGR